MDMFYQIMYQKPNFLIIPVNVMTIDTVIILVQMMVREDTNHGGDLLR